MEREAKLREGGASERGAEGESALVEKGVGG
jgi:hypothetical protein